MGDWHGFPPEQPRLTLAPETPEARAARVQQEAAEKEAYIQLCLRAYLASQRREANWELVRDLLAALRRAGGPAGLVGEEGDGRV